MSGYIKCDKDYKRDYDYDRRCKKDYGYDRKKDCDCYSKKDYDYDRKDCGCVKDKECAKCEVLSPCPKKILVECGTPGGMMMFTSTGQTFTAANVSVDTSCFCKPIIELEFTSQVSAVLDPTAGLDTLNNDVIQQDAEVVLLYELVCRRNGGSEITIGSWTFRRFLSGGLLEAAAIDITNFEAQDLETYDTFSFSKCICSAPCPGCVDYFVRVTATTVSQDTVLLTNNASATVSMGQLVVKVQDC